MKRILVVAGVVFAAISIMFLVIPSQAMAGQWGQQQWQQTKVPCPTKSPPPVVVPPPVKVPCAPTTTTVPPSTTVPPTTVPPTTVPPSVPPSKPVPPVSAPPAPPAPSTPPQATPVPPQSISVATHPGQVRTFPQTVVGSTPVTSTGQLAQTGANYFLLVVLAVICLLIGSALVLYRKKVA